MKPLLSSIFTFIFYTTSMAQQIMGHYKLNGIHDMAAGFEFQADSFKFYCYYGAVDRFAEGTFSIKGDTIVLKGSKEPGKDFTILNQSATAKEYSIKVNAPNEYLAKYVSCIVMNGEEQKIYTPGSDGIIPIDTTKAAKIYLVHELYPDIPTLIKDENNVSTYFEVKLNESLQQVSFKGIDLFIKEGELRWYPNYFIGADNVRFVKTE